MKTSKLQIVLTGVSCAACIGAVIFAVPATIKAKEIVDSKKLADKKEIVENTWKCYIPAATLTAVSVGCAIVGNASSIKEQLKLLASAGTLGVAYNKYRDKIRSLYGKAVDKGIVDEINIEKAKNVHIVAPTIASEYALDPDDYSEEEKMTFYDSFSDRLFESTLRKVIEAEYHLNRNYILRGEASLNEFYDFLGIEHVSDGEDKIWSAEECPPWLDFDHTSSQIDNTDCCIISAMFDPVLAQE